MLGGKDWQTGGQMEVTCAVLIRGTMRKKNWLRGGRDGEFWRGEVIMLDAEKDDDSDGELTCTRVACFDLENNSSWALWFFQEILIISDNWLNNNLYYYLFYYYYFILFVLLLFDNWVNLGWAWTLCREKSHPSLLNGHKCSVPFVPSNPCG